MNLHVYILSSFSSKTNFRLFIPSLDKTPVGCSFQRTTKPNNHKITPMPKGFVNPFGEALFYANFINGALKTAPYGLFASDFR